MTSDDHVDDDATFADVDASAIAVLVRATLAAVADTTDVEARPPASMSDRTGRLDGVDGDRLAGTSTRGEGTELDARSRRAPSGAARWWLAAAAAVLLIVAGVVVALADERTVSTGPAGPSRDELAPTTSVPTALDDVVLLGPPRSIAGLDLVDVQASAWSATGADGSPLDGSTSPVPLPFTATSTSGIVVRFTYARAGEEPNQLQPPLQMILRTGATMAPVGAPTATVPPLPIDGLVGVDGGEHCTVGPSIPDVPAPVTACRTVNVAWTADQLVTVEGDLAAPVGEALGAVRLETLAELEVRLAGVSDVEDIRSVLDYAAEPPPSSGAPTDADPDAGPLPATPSTTAPESSMCTAWGGVEGHLRPTGDVFDAGSGEDLLAFQMFAPPELDADVRRLLQIATVSPPSAEQAEILARIRAEVETPCGALEDLSGHGG